MKKIMNDPSQIVEEMIQGLVLANGDLVERVPDSNVIQRRAPKQGQVALVSGGGSGHEPAHAGFVGKGMLSAAVCGAVFTSPTPDQILKAIQASDEGQGVLLIIKNYSGDLMNFEMAQDLAQMEGIEVQSVIVDDDIAVEDSLYTQGRRGVAGTILVHKILGHLAANGASLDELKSFGDDLVEKIKTIGIALTGAVTPEGGQPNFNLADDEIEYGVGIHGEPGYRTEKLQSSRLLAEELLDRLLADFHAQAGDTFALYVNGLGGTPLMEQYVFYKDVHDLLQDRGFKVAFGRVAEDMTSLEMQGLSLTLVHLDEAQGQDILEGLQAPVETIAW